MMKSHETTRKVMFLRRITHGRKYSWHVLSETLAFTYFFSGTLYLLCFLLRYYSPRSSQGFLLIIQISLQTLLIQNDFLSLLVKANLHPLPSPPAASTSFHLLHHLLVSKLFLVLLFKYLLSIVLHAPP